MQSRILVFFVFGLLGSASLAAAPATPTLAYSINGFTVTVSWTAISNATEYKLSYAPIPYTGPESIGSINVGNTTSFSATLWEGAAFYIAVQAGNGEGFSEYSNIENFTLTTTSTNLTGNWNITETSGPNNCGDSQGVLTNYIGSINQTGASVTASFGGGSFSGNITGNTASLTGSMPDDGGTTSSTINVTILSGTSLSGSISWYWTDGYKSCSGTSSITGSK